MQFASEVDLATTPGPVCVSVINMKGGVGKTTIAALLGSFAANHHKRVLTIDLDPQANLSQAYMRRQYRRFLDTRSPSIVEIFKGHQPPSDHMASPSPLAVDEVVANVEPWHLGSYRTSCRDNLQLIPSRFDFSDHLVGAVRPDQRVLARLIADKFQDKDLVLIDCAPTESIFTQAAYHASRYVLVPVKPEFFATIGFPLWNDSLAAFRRDNRGHRIDVIGVVINNAFYHGGNDGGPEKTTAMEEIREEAERNGWFIFQNEIPHSRGFPKVMRGGGSHLGNAPRFDGFATEFFQKLGLE